MKHIYFLLIMVPRLLVSQCGPNYLNNTTCSSDGNCTFSGIATDTNGCLITIGNFDCSQYVYKSAGTLRFGNTDMVVVKTNSVNSIEWSKSFTSFSDPNTQIYPKSVLCDKAKNVYVSGYYIGAPAFPPYIFPSSSGCFLMKLDGNNGNVLWAKTYTVNGTTSISSIDYDSSTNKIYGTGHFVNPITFGTYSLTSPGAFVTKWDTAGVIINAACYGNSARGSSLKVIPGGDIVVGINYSSAFNMGSTPVIAYGYNDILFSRLDKTTLNPKWSVFTGSNFDDFSTSVTVDAAANIYGLFTFSKNIILGTQTLSTKGDKDIGFTKMDSLGNITWSRTIGGPNRDASSKIIYNDGYLYFTSSCGDSLKFSNGPAITNASRQIVNSLLSKYDTTGNYIGYLLTNDTITTSSSAYLHSSNGLTVDKSQNIYMAGNFLNKINLLGLNTTITPSGNTYANSYVLRICANTLPQGIKENIETNKSITLYPNPANEFFNINSEEKISNVKITDIRGVQIFVSIYTPASFNVSHLPKGIYFVEITTSKAITRAKLVVE